jgi:ribosomal protein S18 acetylase RimI-like enzyme
VTPPVASPVVLRVIEVTEVDDAVVAAIARLLPQLSGSAPPPTASSVGSIVSSPATRLLVAVEDDAMVATPAGQVVGTLTLAVFPIPSGVRAWIEDVITDEAARGRGVGEALTLRALELAREAGARTVELTSRPSRAAANRLYGRLGFEIRKTNVYRFDLDARDTPGRRG